MSTQTDSDQNANPASQFTDDVMHFEVSDDIFRLATTFGFRIQIGRARGVMLDTFSGSPFWNPFNDKKP
jgi:hypothetical protein